MIIHLWLVEQQCTVEIALLICHLTCEKQTLIDYSFGRPVPSEVLYDILVVLHLFNVWILFPLPFVDLYSTMSHIPPKSIINTHFFNLFNNQ